MLTVNSEGMLDDPLGIHLGSTLDNLDNEGGALEGCPCFGPTADVFVTAGVCPTDCMGWECCVEEVLEPTPVSGDETTAYVFGWDFHSCAHHPVHYFYNTVESVESE